MNDLKSIADIAAELQLTKQAVYRRVNNNPETLEQLQPHTITNGTRKYYTLQGQKIIKDLFLLRQCQLNLIDVEPSKPETTTKNSEQTAKTVNESKPELTEGANGEQTEVNPEQHETTTGNGEPLEGENVLHSTQRAAPDEGTAAALQTVIDILREQLKATQEHNTALTAALTAAQEQNKELTQALNNTTAALTTTQAALTAAQALHAGTIQHQLTADHAQSSTDTVNRSPDDLTAATATGEPIREGTKQPTTLLNKLKSIFKKKKGV